MAKRLLDDWEFDVLGIYKYRKPGRLARLGLTADEVPDPGFFVDGQYSSPSVPKPYVMIQLAYAISKLRDYQAAGFVAQMAKVVKHLLGCGYHVVLAPHVLKDDEICSELIEAMGNPPGLHKWNWFRIIREECTIEGLAYY